MGRAKFINKPKINLTLFQSSKILRFEGNQGIRYIIDRGRKNEGKRSRGMTEKNVNVWHKPFYEEDGTQQ